MTCLKSILQHLNDNQSFESNAFDFHKIGENLSISVDKFLQVIINFEIHAEYLI